jgi:hypothetical protein
MVDEDETDTSVVTEERDSAKPGDMTDMIDDEELGAPKFDESYCAGLFILRYFHTICKNTNLAENVEIMVKKGEFITARYPVETLGHLTFCVLECHPNSQ